MDEIAVVLLNYNGRKFLEQFLPVFVKYSEEAKIYVIDNASTDQSTEFLEANFSSLSCIKLDKNYGFTGGYNQALEQIEAKYYVLVNTDIEVSRGWLRPMHQFLEKNAYHAAVQPKVKSFHQREFFEYAGAGGGFMDRLGYPYCRGRVFDHLEKDSGQYNEVSEVFWTTGACFMVRGEVFHRVGGFDRDFFAHMEEIDLCWRLQAEGWKLACIPQSEVYHVGGGTLSKSSPFKTYLNFRNSLIMLTKNLPSALFPRVIWLRLFLDALGGIHLLFTRGPAHLFAVIRAHWHFFFRWKYYAGKRKEIFHLNLQNYRSKTPVSSLIWAFFIRKKRKFSQL